MDMSYARQTSVPTSPSNNDQPAHRRSDSLSNQGAKAFSQLGLSDPGARGAAAAGFSEPTEIQKQVIPLVLAQKDLIGCSQTGSGKTAAFVLPLLDLLNFSSSRIQALVVVPTRELCQQVAGAFRTLSTQHPLKVAEIFGGVSYHGQRQALQRKPQVIVGTPGRLLDLLGTKVLDFQHLRFLILDEADRMLDMGFMPQVRHILDYVPQKRQTLMFSATIPAEVSSFAAVSLNHPVRIQVGQRAKPPAQLVQEAVEVSSMEKGRKLLEVVAAEKGTILVFVGTKRRADTVHEGLTRAGIRACVIHGNRDQKERDKALKGFSTGQYRIMVATDVAQRGLDVKDIALVINYAMPKSAEDYVHRVGRTGRADAVGRALSFVTIAEYSTLKEIERLTGHAFQNFTPVKSSLGSRRSLPRRRW